MRLGWGKFQHNSTRSTLVIDFQRRAKETERCNWKVMSWQFCLVPRPYYSARPKRSGSRGPSEATISRILDKIKWNSKPPSPPNQGWSRAKSKNAPFSHPWFGREWGSRFSIYFVQDCSLRTADSSSAGRIRHFRAEQSGAPNVNFRKNICSEDDLRSRIFGTFVVKFLACLPLLAFSNI